MQYFWMGIYYLVKQHVVIIDVIQNKKNDIFLHNSRAQLTWIPNLLLKDFKIVFFGFLVTKLNTI